MEINTNIILGAALGIFLLSYYSKAKLKKKYTMLTRKSNRTTTELKARNDILFREGLNPRSQREADAMIRNMPRDSINTRAFKIYPTMTQYSNMNAALDPLTRPQKAPITSYPVFSD